MPYARSKIALEHAGVLAEADDLAGVTARLPKAIEVLQESWEQLTSGHIPLVQLLVATTVSRAPGDYRVDTAAASVLRQLADAGLHLHPGERVR